MRALEVVRSAILVCKIYLFFGIIVSARKILDYHHGALIKYQLHSNQFLSHVRTHIDNEIARRDLYIMPCKHMGKWRRGVSPLRSPRSVRDSLPSYGSYCPADGRKPNSQDASSLGSRRAMRPNQWVALRQWPFSLLYFRIAHRTKAN